MNQLDLTLYLGGTSSGKSARAEAQALQAEGPVLYVATAEPRAEDSSMSERIRRHRARRPSSWSTLECPLGLARHIADALAALPARADQSSLSRPNDQEAAESASARTNPQSGGVNRPTILLDCVTLWISNILFSLPDPGDLIGFEAAVRGEVAALLSLMERSSSQWILVSGEVGLGGIAGDQISRNFCDGLGLANQLLAARSQKVFLVVAGRLLPLQA